MTRTVYDDVGYDAPYPAYQVTYNIPTSTPVYFSVSIAANANLPADISDQIKAAITAAFVGSDGGARARIGSTIYASRYYCGIAALSPLVGILSLTVDDAPSPVATSLQIGIDQVPTLDPANIVVTIV